MKLWEAISTICVRENFNQDMVPETIREKYFIISKYNIFTGKDVTNEVKRKRSIWKRYSQFRG